MAQSSISSYFITRKRGIDEELIASKKKVICLEKSASCEVNDADDYSNKIVYPSSSKLPNNADEQKSGKASKKVTEIAAVRQGITPQRTRSSRRVQKQNVDGIETVKIANFFLGGSLSPQKKSKKQLESTEVPKETVQKTTKKDEELIEENHGMRTPTKKPILTTETSNAQVERTTLISTNNLNTDQIKKKLRASSKLTELKTSLNKLRNGFDKLDQMEQKRKDLAKTDKESPSLKPFKNIELEILSPKKTFTSPIKLKDSPMKNTLIGSPKLLSPKRLLFSPTKSSPVKAPAYERFQSLAEAGTPTLQLPFKYRYLLEVFKAIDTVCAMFFNRKEKITFKKLKPAVQRILRKNFYETHLAQIQKLMPNAYKFAQEKTRNYGSTSKQDYYQLVITPNIDNNEDVNQLVLSPQILIQRYTKLTEILTDLVFVQHEKFLQTLDIPMNVTRGAIKRWHPDFNLESVPDIEHGELPLPPNVERFSSAKDVLSTARNLFNCSTPMERALERLEAKKKEEKSKQFQNMEQAEANLDASTPTRVVADEKKKPPVPETPAALLKGVPQSLLEKIRAKQAAKALDTMTRRPSQERDAAKYSRLPEVARHVRNVFVTEKKGVLPLENVLTKIQNSYKATTSFKEVEELLKILSKEQPRFISFHEIRNMMFVKLNRESDLTEVVQKLQELASQKAQIQ